MNFFNAKSDAKFSCMEIPNHVVVVLSVDIDIGVAVAVIVVVDWCKDP